MTGLPPFDDAEAFLISRRETARWLPIALDIARSHGLAFADPHAFATGTNLVLGLGARYVLKLFPPPLVSQFVSERAALGRLRRQLTVPTPEIIVEGERDGWRYLVMTRLDGVLGSEVWPSLSESSKEKLLREIGETIRQVQQVPVAGDLAAIEPCWPQFVARQIAGCRARQLRLGLPQKYWDELDELVAAAPALIPTDARPVILTGEYIPENFLLTGDGDDWRLAGLFDFGDVMTGWGEYDLLGPSAFMSAGRPGRVRSLFKGFGCPPGEIDPAMIRRLLTLTFLHRASDPLKKIALEGWQHRAATLGELGRMIWPIDRL